MEHWPFGGSLIERLKFDGFMQSQAEHAWS